MTTTFYGTSGNDFYQYSGSDSLIAYGYGGNDLILGNTNIDRIYGGEGDDSVFGNFGNDSLVGEAGDDILYGGAGHDILTGSNPQVWNSGSGELDTLHGGHGADQFILGDSYEPYYQGEGEATILDFNGFEGDKIHLHGNRDDYTVITTYMFGPNHISIFLGQEFGDRIAYVPEESYMSFNFNRDVIFL